MRAEREQAVARRKDALTGTSDFPDLAEAPVTVLDVAPVGAALSGRARVRCRCRSIRLAEPFEQLRDASDRMLAQTGARPKIFLANLGTPADFTARATFAKNFFEAGGIEAVSNDGFAEPRRDGGGIQEPRARSSPACARPTRSMRGRPPTPPRRWRRPAPRVYLAGRPGEREQALRAAGIEGFIFAGCDALAALRAAHALIAR